MPRWSGSSSFDLMVMVDSETRCLSLSSAFFLPPGIVSQSLGPSLGSECNQTGSGKRYQACNRRHRPAQASLHVSMRSLLVFGFLVASAGSPHAPESARPGDSQMTRV